MCRSWPVVISVGSRAFELSFSAQKRGVQWDGGREDQAGVESRTMVIGASAMERAALSSVIRTSTCAMEGQYHPPSPAKTQVKTARTRSNITVVTVDRTSSRRRGRDRVRSKDSSWSKAMRPGGQHADGRQESTSYKVRLQSTDIRHVPDKVYQPGHKEHKDNYLISRNGSQSEYVSKRELMRS